jgi:hypothetical protein
MFSFLNQGAIMLSPLNKYLAKGGVIQPTSGFRTRLTEVILASLKNEEELVVDDRAAIGPAQMVENKLNQMRSGAFLGVSNLRLQNMISKRGD